MYYFTGRQNPELNPLSFSNIDKALVFMIDFNKQIYKIMFYFCTLFYYCNYVSEQTWVTMLT